MLYNKNFNENKPLVHFSLQWYIIDGKRTLKIFCKNLLGKEFSTVVFGIWIYRHKENPIIASLDLLLAKSAYAMLINVVFMRKLKVHLILNRKVIAVNVNI